MAASGKAGWDKLFEPKVPGFPKAALNDLASVERLVTERTVAVMLEPIQGEAGVLPATDGFLRELHAFTQARGLLLIVDEVQTGIGRTGKLFGYEHAGIEPDIMTLGKGIGGGVPLGALVARQAACCFEHGDQGGTYNGNPLMTAVGCAVMETLLAPGFLDGVAERGRQLTGALRQLAAKHGLGEVRGRGLLVALDLGREAGAKVVDAARERGLLINSPRPETLRFMPALTTTRAEIDAMLGLLDQALGSVLAR
jgi:acetylornithine/N-succinyldiaminopimelate aminotransferase